MKPAPKLRLFVVNPLTEGMNFSLGAAQSHYLLHVMRKSAGDEIAVFNGQDGEWLAVLGVEGKRTVTLSVHERLCPQGTEPDLWLLFAPVKRQRVDLMIEKATELGVSEFLPVWTRNTAATRVNEERLLAIAAEAAEQCRRLSVPAIRPARDLAAVLGDWPAGRPLLMLDERGGKTAIADALTALAPGPMALLVGPEGGFAEAEQNLLEAQPFTVGVGLGPRILRAETAAISALACVQALVGDWRKTPDGRDPPSSGP